MTPDLRGLISVPGHALVLPGVTNALGARIAADLGFDAVYLTGAGLTNSELALPDLGFISLDEVATQVGRIRDAVDLAIVVDADTGFGNALNVTRCVRVLERSGANAIQIEDQVFPKRCGHFSGKAVASLDEMVTKIKAVADTRRSEEFLVVARTDALAVSDMDEVLRRTHAFADAGADVIFVEALTTRDEIAEVPRHVDLPLLINIVEGGTTPLLETSELEALYQDRVHGQSQADQDWQEAEREFGLLYPDSRSPRHPTLDADLKGSPLRFFASLRLCVKLFFTRSPALLENNYLRSVRELTSEVKR